MISAIVYNWIPAPGSNDGHYLCLIRPLSAQMTVNIVSLSEQMRDESSDTSLAIAPPENTSKNYLQPGPETRNKTDEHVEPLLGTCNMLCGQHIKLISFMCSVSGSK